MMKTLKERFLKRITIIDPEKCWDWPGGIKQGYGFLWNNNKYVYAHRVSYQELVGPIPDGLQIDHLCRNRKCVNPNHLEAVTAEENKRRGVSPCAKNTRKTQCKNKHDYDHVRGGGRRCKQCDAETNRAWRLKNYERIRAYDRMNYRKKMEAKNKTPNL